MPTYQYACTACGHRFDAVQSFSDPSLTDCPECAGRLRKVFSSVGIVFKGSGFYRTDSRAGANGSEKSSADVPAAASSGSSGSSGKDGGSTGTESKKFDAGSTKSGSSDSSGSSSSTTKSAPAAAAS